MKVYNYDLLGGQQEYASSIDDHALDLCSAKIDFGHYLFGSEVVELYVFVIVIASNVVPACHVLNRQMDRLFTHHFNAPFFFKLL